MALSGLEIYKLLPKTNCKKCGSPTCLAFAMQLAAKKISLDKCPYVSDEAKARLSAAAAPPIRLVSLGRGEEEVKVGNETVLFRHEQTFHHPAGIGCIISDTLSPADLEAKLAAIEKLEFERVGQKIKVNLLAIKNDSKDKDKFKEAVEKVCHQTQKSLVLMSRDPEAMEKALSVVGDRRPLLHAADQENHVKMAELAKQKSLPLVVFAPDLEGLANLTQAVVGLGVEDIILDTGEKPLRKKLYDLTQIRRQALKKNFRPLGYPVLVDAGLQRRHGDGGFQNLAEGAIYLAKYAGLILFSNLSPEMTLPILTLRQDIYTDPQKPSQVEPKIYEIGQVTDKSPVIVTTNFSITYYTVAGEVEASKVPTFLIAANAEGMSVLTAWAAEKFTAESIARILKESDISKKVSLRQVIIPGYVAVLSGKLEEDSGWKVLVGPREASGIPAFLKSLT